MQASPSPAERSLDPYRMRRRPLSAEQIAQIAAHLHIAHLAELRRLRDFQRRFDRAFHHTPRKQPLRVNDRLELGLPPPTWRSAPGPRSLQDLFDSVPKLQTGASEGAGVSVGSGSGVGVGAGWTGAAGAWRAARGWAAAALLLLAALFLLRATDRFFTKSYLRWRRSRSEEWPTPSVLATSNVPTSDAEPEAAGATQEPFPGDAPPPYSECSIQKPEYEEPPPPYSACYVEFMNPKDGVPAVHFYNSRRQNIFEDMDAGASSTEAPQDPNAEAPEVAGAGASVATTSKAVGVC